MAICAIIDVVDGEGTDKTHGVLTSLSYVEPYVCLGQRSEYKHGNTQRRIDKEIETNVRLS